MAIAPTDAALGRLNGMGLTPVHAARGYNALMLHGTAIATEQDRRRSQKDPAGQAQHLYEQATADRLPHVAALRTELSPVPGPPAASEPSTPPWPSTSPRPSTSPWPASQPPPEPEA
ncbi:hypothetical protein ACFWFB_33105 [Streptomyces albidoflavus]